MTHTNNTQDILSELNIAMNKISNCAEMLKQMHQQAIVSESALRSVRNLSVNLSNQFKAIEMVRNQFESLNIV